MDSTSPEGEVEGELEGRLDAVDVQAPGALWPGGRRVDRRGLDTGAGAVLFTGPEEGHQRPTALLEVSEQSGGERKGADEWLDVAAIDGEWVTRDSVKEGIDESTRGRRNPEGSDDRWVVVMQQHGQGQPIAEALEA